MKYFLKCNDRKDLAKYSAKLAHQVLHSFRTSSILEGAFSRLLIIAGACTVIHTVSTVAGLVLVWNNYCLCINPALFLLVEIHHLNHLLLQLHIKTIKGACFSAFYKNKIKKIKGTSSKCGIIRLIHVCTHKISCTNKQFK